MKGREMRRESGAAEDGEQMGEWRAPFCQENSSHCCAQHKRKNIVLQCVSLEAAHIPRFLTLTQIITKYGIYMAYLYPVPYTPYKAYDHLMYGLLKMTF